MENQRDEKLWKKAEERVAFKKHLTTYIIINIFLWLLWYFTGGRINGAFPWPIFTTIGWGIGITIHYVKTYISDEESDVEKEYEKLKNKRQ
ncbi:MAG: hypothetical protein ACJAT1_000631 [Marivirga sp.]|jgi:hypothetical protein